MKKEVLIISAEGFNLNFIDDVLLDIPIIKKSQAESSPFLLNRLHFIFYCCTYNCALRSCAGMFQRAMQDIQVPFGIIRPAVISSKSKPAKGFFLSLLKEYNLSSEQLKIIQAIRQSRYYACSPLLGVHPTHILFKIMRVQKEIAENPRSRLSLQHLCSLVHLSPAWLSKKFKEVGGVSLQRFALKIRFCQALWEILSSEKPIKRVAFEFGYKPSSFGKRFHLVWGIPPEIIRK